MARPLPLAARLSVQDRVAHRGAVDRPARRAQRARAAAHARARGLHVPPDARRLRAAPAGLGRAQRRRPDHSRRVLPPRLPRSPDARRRASAARACGSASAPPTRRPTSTTRCRRPRPTAAGPATRARSRPRTRPRASSGARSSSCRRRCPTVPEVVIDEPAGDGVLALVDLPALLPAVTIPAGHRVQLDRIALDDVVGCMSANAERDDRREVPRRRDGELHARQPDRPGRPRRADPQRDAGGASRTASSWTSSCASRGQLEPLWLQALPAPVAFGALTDTLAPKAGRFVHRIRIADQAGHLSAGAAIAPRVVRVPSLRSPSPPRARDEPRRRRAGCASRRACATRSTSRGCCSSSSRGGRDRRRPTATCATRRSSCALPNARDRYPDDGLRLRLADATLLAPAFVLDASGRDRRAAGPRPGDDARGRAPTAASRCGP